MGGNKSEPAWSKRTRDEHMLALGKLALDKVAGNLFRSSLGSPMVRLPINGVVRVSDEATKDWLTELGYSELSFLPNSQQLNRVVRLLRARVPRQTSEPHLGDEVLEVLQNQPLVQAICEAMHQKSSMTKTVGKWLSDLKVIAKSLGINTDSKRWPKTSAVLSRFVKQVQPLLLELGIEVRGWKDTNFGMELTLALREPDDNNEPSDTSSSASSQSTKKSGRLTTNEAVKAEHHELLAKLKNRKQSAGVVEASNAVVPTVQHSTFQIQGQE